MMRKLLFVACCAVFALTSCNDKKAAQLVSAQTDSLNQVIAQRDTELNDMLSTLNDIQEGFQAINEAEGRVSISKSGEGGSRSQQLKDNVAFIAQRMAENRELIEKLKKQVASGSYKSSQLQKTIENLTKQLEEKETELTKLRAELDAKDIHIAELDETVNNLNTNVTNLAAEGQQKSEVISNQDKQLNTAWYVFGTKKELKEQHIIEDGEVLTASFNKNYFTKIDIREDTEIKLYSTSAKLLTAHPASSYNLTRDANKQYVLRITDPQIFWSTSKYLVIQVK